MDDAESRLIFVKGTDVLADVELGPIRFPDDLTGFSREQARFMVSHDDFYAILTPQAWRAAPLATILTGIGEGAPR